MNIIFHNHLEKKGISPVLATIFLIGFVVIVVVIIWLWSENVYEEHVEKEGTIAQEQLRCSGVAIEIEQTSGTIYVRNTGTLLLKGLRLREDLDDGSSRISDVFTDIIVGETFPLTQTNVICALDSQPESPGSLCGNTAGVVIEPSLQPIGRGAPLVSCLNARVSLEL